MGERFGQDLCKRELAERIAHTVAERAEAEIERKLRIRKPLLETGEQILFVFLITKAHNLRIPALNVAVRADRNHVGHHIAFERADPDVIGILRAKIFVERSKILRFHNRKYCSTITDKTQANSFGREKFGQNKNRGFPRDLRAFCAEIDRRRKCVTNFNIY